MHPGELNSNLPVVHLRGPPWLLTNSELRASACHVRLGIMDYKYHKPSPKLHYCYRSGSAHESSSVGKGGKTTLEV